MKANADKYHINHINLDVILESAKLRTLRAHVPTCLACLRAQMPTCLACLRAHVSTCQRALRACILTCQSVLRAYVLTCQRALRALRATMPCVLCVLTPSRAITTDNKNKFPITCFPYIYIFVIVLCFFPVK